MEDFFEVLDFCAFDVDKAAEIVKFYERQKEEQNGVAKIQPEPARTDSR